MKFDYYLFDLDNSLLHIPNPSEYFDDVLRKTLELLSSTPKRVPGRNERNQFWRSGEGYIRLLEHWGIENHDDFWKHFDALDFEKRKIFVESEQIYLYPDVEDALTSIYRAGKKMALISNTADYIVDYILDKFNIQNYFNHVFGLGFEKDQSVAKPSPDGILSILNSLDYKPDSCKAMMVGDSMVDVYAAKRANIDACLIVRVSNKYPDGYKDWEFQPDYIIKNLAELFEL